MQKRKYPKMNSNQDIENNLLDITKTKMIDFYDTI